VSWAPPLAAAVARQLRPEDVPERAGGRGGVGHRHLDAIYPVEHVVAAPPTRCDSTSEMRILVVEDERKVAAFVRQGLVEEGHAVEVAADGAAALEAVAEGPPFDLVVLDVMLPKRDGLDVLKSLRALRIQTPVLLLTARDGVADKVAGLDAGADDYLAKPFAFEEFLARVRALLRRGRGRAEPVLRLADLSLDPATRAVLRGSRRLSLTAREYALLEYFLRNTGRVLTRPMITQHVWGMDWDPESNIVDVYVGYLRRKVDADGEPRLLQTVRGAGYTLSAEP
jgi:DNA-binding response OmpR family regulator